MKKAVFIAVSILLVLISPVYAADDVQIMTENNIVTVSNAPENSTLIAAFYKDGILFDARLNRGSGTITADISQGAAEADKIKMFLWDMDSIRPLTEKAYEVSTADKITIEANGRIMTATIENNSSAQALLELLRESPITVQMHDYGNFEKVGGLGAALPRNDEEITTEPGDLILYQGNQITIYYDTNTWSFTRLGKIDNITQSELMDILGDGDVTVTFSLHDAQH